MPLEGDAKRDYQREYMRKKRAGKPTTQPKPKQAGPKPTSQQKARVRDWLKLPWHHRSDVGQRLTSDMGKGMMGESLGPIDEEEAMRRYQQHLAERRAPKPVEPKHCSFCDEPQSDERRLYTTDGYALICWECAQRVVDAEAKGPINDLKAKMKAMREDQKVTGGRMSHKTVGVISMAFHPDGGMPTREELDNAMKVFNQWKADNKDAKRGKS